jgi:hypothetical protein
MNGSRWFTAACAFALAALACSIPGVTGDPALQATQMALGVQQTSMAIQQMTASAPPPAETYTPYPTFTQPAPPVEAATLPAATDVDMRARIRASNILIYEDIVGDPTLMPVVTSTINAMGFSGGKVINTGDALGMFKEHANSATQWDLIIVAAEIRTAFSGEMFEVMYDHVNNGGAVVIEIWYLDKIVSGKIAPILSKCGVTFFRDWWRNPDYNPFDYSIYWLEKSHPLLSTPNIVQAPSYPYPEWFGDAGDMLKLGSSGDAVLVGGLHASRKTDHGVLASCLDGRMVIQTFSSHDYKWDAVQPLWENYITYTLTRHYEYMP